MSESKSRCQQGLRPARKPGGSTAGLLNGKKMTIELLTQAKRRQQKRVQTAFRPPLFIKQPLHLDFAATTSHL